MGLSGENTAEESGLLYPRRYRKSNTEYSKLSILIPEMVTPKIHVTRMTKQRQIPPLLEFAEIRARQPSKSTWASVLGQFPDLPDHDTHVRQKTAIKNVDYTNIREMN